MRRAYGILTTIFLFYLAIIFGAVSVTKMGVMGVLRDSHLTLIIDYLLTLNVSYMQWLAIYGVVGLLAVAFGFYHGFWIWFSKR